MSLEHGSRKANWHQSLNAHLSSSGLWGHFLGLPSAFCPAHRLETVPSLTLDCLHHLCFLPNLNYVCHLVRNLWHYNTLLQYMPCSQSCHQANWAPACGWSLLSHDLICTPTFRHQQSNLSLQGNNNIHEKEHCGCLEGKKEPWKLSIMRTLSKMRPEN